MSRAPSSFSTARSGRAMSPTNSESPVSTAHGSGAARGVDERERGVLGPVPGRVDGAHDHAAQRELPAVLERLVLVLGLRERVDVDQRAGRRREPAVARDVVGVVVGLEDVLDRDAEVAREPQVLADVQPRVDHGRDARFVVADEVGGAAEVLVRDLAEDHAGNLPCACITLRVQPCC